MDFLGENSWRSFQDRNVGAECDRKVRFGEEKFVFTDIY